MRHRTFAIAALACCAGTAAHAAPPRYAISLVDTLPDAEICAPNSLNDSGQVVGSCGLRAFVWTPGMGVLELSAGAGLTTSAEAINASGKVAGVVRGPASQQAYLWDTTLGFQWIGGLDPSAIDSFAYSLNDADQVAGESVPATPSRNPHAFRWSVATGITDLTPRSQTRSAARAINNLGDVVGFGNGGVEDVAYVIDAAGAKTRLRPLQAGQQVAAYALNDLRHAVGSISDVASGITRAALWSPSGAPRLLDRRQDPRAFSIAFGINAAGQVVGVWRDARGASAFYWDDAEGMLDLNRLLDPDDPLRASVRIYGSAPHLNSAGQIAVAARVAGMQRAIVLTPLAPGR